MMDDDSILEFEDFHGGFDSTDGYTEVLHGVSFTVRRSVLTAVVGETGSGKTLTALSVLGLAQTGFRRTSGAIRFRDSGRTDDVTGYREADFRRIRGSRVAMVFQDSRVALNPVFSIGRQLSDTVRLHHGLNRKAARTRSEELLARVRVPEPGRRMGQYPHELSGGTVQRIQLALALACSPSLLLLDEPTTGLDVTIQADILELIVDLTRAEGLSACMITHDLGVVAETCQDVVVMRNGAVCETGSCEQVMTAPQHEYTQELLAASRFGVAA
jgi:ABC-type dipeptide/oligopeptide/nickel transport system ATPase component